MSKLVEELKKLPEYSKFKEAVENKLTLGNYYVSCFAPDKSGYTEEKDDDGKIVYHHYKLTDEQMKEEAVDNLLEDESGLFEEFVTEELRLEVVELARAIIKDMRG